MTPTVRAEAAKALLSRAEWTLAFLDGVEKGDVSLSQLSLAQSQALVYPDRSIAARAKALIGKGGGLPDPDRQKVIDGLAPLVLKGGDAAREGLHRPVRPEVPCLRRQGGRSAPACGMGARLVKNC